MLKRVYLSVVIPAFNEERRLHKTLEKVRSYLEHSHITYEIIVVNDGSEDETLNLVKKTISMSASRWANLRLISYPENKGKGYAVKKGMLAARGKWRLLMDADNSTSIAELKKLLLYVSDYNIIIGSRYLDKYSIKKKQSIIRRFISRGGSFLIRVMLGLKITDTQCGFKLFSAKATKDIFPLQTISRWGFDMEILTIAKRKGYKIKEVAVDWYNSEGSQMKNGVAAKTLCELWQIKKNIWNGEY